VTDTSRPTITRVWNHLRGRGQQLDEATFRIERPGLVVEGPRWPQELVVPT